MTDFLGKPVNGDITHYVEGQAEQHDPQEFLDRLNAVLEIPEVVAVRWSQYTPYFNDGDPCVFNTGEITVKLQGFDLAGDSDGFVDSYDLHYRNRGLVPAELIKKIDTALDRVAEIIVHHYAVLQKKFGDPAEVTYDGEKFSVEFYEHG